jgi:hypothetical protein
MFSCCCAHVGWVACLLRVLIRRQAIHGTTRSLQAAVAEARQSCKLPFLVGAAAVCYGVPTASGLSAIAATNTQSTSSSTSTGTSTSTASAAATTPVPVLSKKKGAAAKDKKRRGGGGGGSGGGRGGGGGKRQ